MRVAYVDTSCLVAIAFDESQGPETATQLAAYDRLYADNLLEAEFRSALAREGIDQDQDDLLSRVTWVFPAEALGEEYRTALGGGQLRGADLRHVACAIFVERLAGPIDFVSLDARQRRAASRAGLTTPR